jgi:glycosyltransferase involved in cell wall biosynthesis
MQDKEFPFVSVIIPVRNSEKSIIGTLESLKKIDYPEDRFEIIIIDNKSTDRTPLILKDYPFKVLSEDKKLGSYAARNRGITNAKGDLLVFTDGDCIVTRDWISSYVKYFQETPSDLIAGTIEIVIKSKESICETYDKCKFDQEFFVREFHFGATANLLVRKMVFEKIGVFDNSLVSSGDLEFCQRAYRSGFKINYCNSALVQHPARSNLMALLKKEARIGFGYSQIYFRHKLGNLFFHRWRLFIPNRDFLRFKSGELRFGRYNKAKFVFIDWLCNWAWIYGNMHGIMKLNKK